MKDIQQGVHYITKHHHTDLVHRSVIIHYNLLRLSRSAIIK